MELIRIGPRDLRRTLEDGTKQAAADAVELIGSMATKSSRIAKAFVSLRISLTFRLSSRQQQQQQVCLARF